MTANGKSNEAERYLDVIRWNTVNHLTLHDGLQSRLFHDRESSTALVDAKRYIRGLLGGVARSASEFAKSVLSPRERPRTEDSEGILLITVGTSKYAGEEKEIIRACAAKRLNLYLLHLSNEARMIVNDRTIPLERLLSPIDHLIALRRWLWRVSIATPYLFSSNRKTRAIYAASISDIRGFTKYEIYARRLQDVIGKPKAVFSLCPSHSASNAMMEIFKKSSIATAGIRTQTTSKELEHRAINTEILFCKGHYEQNAYREIFDERGPVVIPGCIFSIPEEQVLKPLALSERYALLLGTAPAVGQNRESYFRYIDRLFEVAKSLGLSPVYKGHNLARHLDAEWRERKRNYSNNAKYIDEAARNRELIERSALVVSASSTLLYYAMIISKPIVLLESDHTSEYEDEFMGSPITRIQWNAAVSEYALNMKVLRANVIQTTSWFERNYYVKESTECIIEKLMNRGCSMRSGNAQTELNRLTMRQVEDQGVSP